MVQVARAAEDTATAQALAYMYLKRDGHLRLRTVLVVLELFPLAGQIVLSRLLPAKHTTPGTIHFEHNTTYTRRG